MNVNLSTTSDADGKMIQKMLLKCEQIPHEYDLAPGLLTRGKWIFDNERWTIRFCRSSRQSCLPCVVNGIHLFVATSSIPVKNKRESLWWAQIHRTAKVTLNSRIEILSFFFKILFICSYAKALIQNGLNKLNNADIT